MGTGGAMRVMTGVAVLAFVGTVLVGQAPAGDQAKASAAPKAADKVVTGQHRGFTNDKLYLKLDDEKEITLIVDIPGDKDRKWQKDFQVNSRITVTYHAGADGRLVATSIKQAEEKGK